VGLGTVVCEGIGVGSANGGARVSLNKSRTSRMASAIPRIHFAAGDRPVFILVFNIVLAVGQSNSNDFPILTSF
jgi:hypothetical protein